MRIDGGLGLASNMMPGAESGALAPSKVAARAARIEAEGYDGIWSVETNHDPFLPLALAAESTTVELGTSIAVAFARSPMTTAVTANDLHGLTGGRFVLGLGSQIRPHIERRFSMPWSSPAARMTEYISAMHAIWDCWNEGTKLDFRGDFYTHTLMTPFFDPGPNPFGRPKVFLAGVGRLMTEAAGEVSDGFICHAFTTERYLREVTVPALEAGAARSGRSLEDVEVSGPAFVVTGSTEEEMAASARGTRQQIAFYGSTPAYRPVLELHGWGELQTELNAMSKQGKWEEMADAIDDDVLAAFAVIAEPQDIAARFEERYGDVVDRLFFYAPYESDPELWGRVMADLKAIGGS